MGGTPYGTVWLIPPPLRQSYSVIGGLTSCMQYCCVTIPPAVRPSLSPQLDMGSNKVHNAHVGACRTHEGGSGTNKSARELTSRDWERQTDCTSPTPPRPPPPPPPPPGYRTLQGLWIGSLTFFCFFYPFFFFFFLCNLLSFFFLFFLFFRSFCLSFCLSSFYFLSSVLR